LCQLASILKFNSKYLKLKLPVRQKISPPCFTPHLMCWLGSAQTLLWLIPLFFAQN
jgi:hypothetical protein